MSDKNLIGTTKAVDEPELIGTINYTSDGTNADLSDYYTKEQVDKKIADIELKPGPEGKPGIQGPAGKEGPQGPQGIPGKDGLPGAPGKQGAVGPQGPEGQRGQIGPQGKPGAPGAAGKDGLDGENGLPGKDGKDGRDALINNVNTLTIVEGKNIKLSQVGNQLTISSTASGGGGTGENGATFIPAVSPEGEISWTNDKGLENPAPVSIKGPKGDTGAEGKVGPQGPAGEKGADGAPGKDGTNGKDGAPGKDGANGAPGVKGDQGPEGPAGPRGEAGQKGEPGAQGIPGEKGEQGPAGAKGDTGDSGVYRGSQEPIDPEIKVWLDPNGSASENLATQQYVDDAIANIDIPDVTPIATTAIAGKVKPDGTTITVDADGTIKSVGGGGGSGGSVYYCKSNLMLNNPDDKKMICDWYKNFDTWTTTVYLFNQPNYILPSTVERHKSLYTPYLEMTMIDDSQQYWWRVRYNINDDGTFKNTQIIESGNIGMKPATSGTLGLVRVDNNTITIDSYGTISASSGGGGGGGSWHFTNDRYSSDIYNAKILIVRFKVDGNWYSFTWAPPFDDYLGAQYFETQYVYIETNNTFVQFTYDGSSLNCNWSVMDWAIACYY